MLTAKQLLIKQTAEAFGGRADMPLLASLNGVTQNEAVWQFDPSTPTIDQIVRHVAWAKSRFCQQAFGTAMVLADESVNSDGDCAGLPSEFPCGGGWGTEAAPGIDNAIVVLKQTHVILTRCLLEYPEDGLELSLPTHHGKSAAHFFWIMIMHDLYHAGQIRTRRSAWRASGRLIE